MNKDLKLRLASVYGKMVCDNLSHKRQAGDKYICCPYNVAVKCAERDMEHDCFSCGWFPMEDHRRREVLRKLAKYNCLRREDKRHV